MRAGNLAEALGKGIVAGVVGTAAMTVSSTLEAKLRHRAGSSAPADAAGKVLGVQPRNPAGQARFATVVHWAYGTAWGGLRGILAGLGLSPAASTAAHFGAVWGGELVMLPRLGVAEPATTWGAAEVAIDAWHHLVYASATGVAYELLDRHTLR